jgi:DNA ligase-1
VEAFAALFEQIDQTTSTNEKVRMMVEFFRRHDADTSAWALFFLSGRRPKQLIGSAKLRRWAQEFLGYPDWMMEECYAAVGDTAEMVALLVAGEGHVKHPAPAQQLSLGGWMTQRIWPLADVDDESRRDRILGWWHELDRKGIFILNKLLTGALRVGVSETLVYRALAEVMGLPQAVVASRLVGAWHPNAEFFAGLGNPLDAVLESRDSPAVLLPLPFCLAAPLEGDPGALGDVGSWQCEWKWDGIRCQVVKGGARLEIWSRGEDCVTASFPDLARALLTIPGDWILDGEIVAGEWRRPRSFHALQRRLNRKKPSAAVVAGNAVSFLAYDLLQLNGEPLGHRPLEERRISLERLLASSITDQVGLSPLLSPSTWQELTVWRAGARTHGAEGIMIKNRQSRYEAGRKRGIWFKWKIDPLTIDAVITAAQPGTGRRASLYTDYTFSIWSDGRLVPVAKAYSGLTDAEIRELDGWIRKHTVERFGPVRAVEPLRVFEIGFEGIAASERHKSGYALRFPRILRERKDKRPQDADRLEGLALLLGSLARRPGDPVPAPYAPPTSGDSEQMSFDLGDQAEVP